MKLKLTKHFEDMMQHRNIDIDHVKAAFNEPDRTEDTYDNKQMAWKMIGDREIVVVYCKEGFRDKKDEYLIITAYYIKL